MRDDSFQPVKGIVIFPSQDPAAAFRLAKVEFLKCKLQQGQHLRILTSRVAERFIERLPGCRVRVKAQSGNLSGFADNLANLNERWRGEMVGSGALGQFEKDWIFREAVIKVASEGCKHEDESRTGKCGYRFDEGGPGSGRKVARKELIKLVDQ